MFLNYFFNFLKAATLHIPWRDSISRPIAPVTTMTGGNVTSRPRRQGNLGNNVLWVLYGVPIILKFNVFL
jgi:hypothetical protein